MSTIFVSMMRLSKFNFIVKIYSQYVLTSSDARIILRDNDDNSLRIDYQYNDSWEKQVFIIK